MAADLVSILIWFDYSLLPILAFGQKRKVFQFLYGSITVEGADSFRVGSWKFQFLYGSITVGR